MAPQSKEDKDFKCRVKIYSNFVQESLTSYTTRLPLPPIIKGVFPTVTTERFQVVSIQTLGSLRSSTNSSLYNFLSLCFLCSVITKYVMIKNNITYTSTFLKYGQWSKAKH